METTRSIFLLNVLCALTHSARVYGANGEENLVSGGKKSPDKEDKADDTKEAATFLKNIARHFKLKGSKFAEDSGREVWAIAEFTGDVHGEVVVDEGGNMEINLDVSLLDEAICREYSYHVYNKWGSNDMTAQYGEDCRDIIGGNVNVSVFCIHWTNVQYLEEHLDPFGTGICCDDLDNGEDIGYFNCEMGDLSGRFGTVSPNDEGIIFLEGVVASSSNHDKSDGRISPEVLYKNSVAFECKDDSREIVVCAPFQVRVYDYDNPVFQKLKKK